jgi:hypothetical protein
MSDGKAGPNPPEGKGSLSFQVNGLAVFAAGRFRRNRQR